MTTDAESDSESDSYDSEYYSDNSDYDVMPHEYRNQSIIEYIFNLEEERYMSVVAIKVMEYTRLVPLIDSLMLSLLNSSGDEDDFAGKVNELLNCPDFAQACADTYFSDEFCCSFFTFFIGGYKNEKLPHERMKNLRDDPFLGRFLDEIKTSPTRGVLSALFGFWIDGAFYRKVISVIAQHIAIHGNC